jgi:hypothetical protein
MDRLWSVSINHTAAEQFVFSAARLLDRHRYTMLFCDGAAQPVLDTLAGYRNQDGGFGHALEPDLRCPSSQPAATLYALETLNEAGVPDCEMARDARTWIAKIAEADGGIPFALTGFEDYPHTFWWSQQPGSFLTFALAGALHASGVTDDEWLTRASDWCWQAIQTTEQPGGYWLKYACVFLDATPEEDRARDAIALLAQRVDPAAIAPAGGAEGETLRPLDISPLPASRTRELISDAKIQAHLDELESTQQQDGGWTFDWLAWSPAQTAAWRGIVTIRALLWLRHNGRQS